VLGGRAAGRRLLRAPTCRGDLERGVHQDAQRRHQRSPLHHAHGSQAGEEAQQQARARTLPRAQRLRQGQLAAHQQLRHELGVLLLQRRDQRRKVGRLGRQLAGAQQQEVRRLTGVLLRQLAAQQPRHLVDVHLGLVLRALRGGTGGGTGRGGGRGVGWAAVGADRAVGVFAGPHQGADGHEARDELLVRVLHGLVVAPPLVACMLPLGALVAPASAAATGAACIRGECMLASPFPARGRSPGA
jgi:hypothetical protein